MTIILIRLLDNHENCKGFDQNYLQEIVDHRILILDFKDFDQNSGVQPGQIILKQFLVSLDSSKKRTNKFVLFAKLGILSIKKGL